MNKDYKAIFLNWLASKKKERIFFREFYSDNKTNGKSITLRYFDFLKRHNTKSTAEYLLLDAFVWQNTKNGNEYRLDLHYEWLEYLTKF